MRCLYQTTRDVVTFDTIYKTNKYHLSLRLFCGSYHHKSSMIFSTTFISKENIESFIWVFQKFVKCMGSPSKTIITDQDLTTKATIEMVFHRIFHCMYKWHITNKMGDRIGSVYKNKSAMREFSC